LEKPGLRMTYYFNRTIPVEFEEAITKVTDALREEGFGIISEIDVKETLKKKIGVDFRKYRILGACNPTLAHKALQLEDKVGTMLPCNVILQDKGEGETEVAAIDPLASMAAIENVELKRVAQHVHDKLRRVVESL
jgi:uncharacterized protein (DUF302 family)